MWYSVSSLTVEGPMGFLIGGLVGVWIGGGCYLYAEGRLLGDGRATALWNAVLWPLHLLGGRSL